MPILKPARPEMIIRDPVTRQPLAAAGEEKILDAFWRRRRNDGDVVEVAPPKPARSRAAATGGDAS